jgi:hypothetical protein
MNVFALFTLSVALLPALLLAPFLLPSLFELLFLITQMRCEVGARWGGVALWGTLLRLSVVAGAGFIDKGAE